MAAGVRARSIFHRQRTGTGTNGSRIGLGACPTVGTSALVFVGSVAFFRLDFAPLWFVRAPVLTGWIPVAAQVSTESGRHKIPDAMRGEGRKMPRWVPARRSEGDAIGDAATKLAYFLWQPEAREWTVSYVQAIDINRVCARRRVATQNTMHFSRHDRSVIQRNGSCSGVGPAHRCADRARPASEMRRV